MRYIYTLLASLLVIFTVRAQKQKESEHNYDVAEFTAKAKQVGLTGQQIANILEARQKRDIEMELGSTDRIINETNVVPLFDYELGKSSTYNRYDRYIASQITFSQYKELFEDQIAPQIEKAVKLRIESEGWLDGSKIDKQNVRYMEIYQQERERLFTLHYYHYDKELMLDKLLELRKQKSASSTKEVLAALELINRAETLGISREKIDAIIAAKKIEQSKIQAYKNQQKRSESNYLIQFEDDEYDRDEITQEYRRIVSQTLSKKEFYNLYKGLLADQFEREANSLLQYIEQQYELNNVQRQELIEFIGGYSEKIVVNDQYFKYDKKKSYTAKTVARNRALVAIEKKLATLKLKEQSIEVLADERAYKDFAKKAKNTGVASATISSILKEVIKRDRQLNYITNLSKMVDESILYLDPTLYSKSAVRSQFKEFLKDHISISQYQQIFSRQMKEQIQELVKEKMEVIKKTYELSDTQANKLKALVESQAGKEITIKNYYAYDSKAVKQKLRALQYRFQAKFKDELSKITN